MDSLKSLPENADNKQQEPTESGDTGETPETSERVDLRRRMETQESISQYVTEDNFQLIVERIIEETNLSDLEETDEEDEEHLASSGGKKAANKVVGDIATPEDCSSFPSITTILTDIKGALNTQEDTKEKVLEHTKTLLLGVISQDEKEKLNLKYEGYTEWDNRKKQANANNGKIGEYDFSYIFKVYEDYEENPKDEEVTDGPSASGQPLPPPPPPAAPGPPPSPGKEMEGEERKLKKLHWRVLPPTQTEGDTIWSSSATVDWNKKFFGRIFTEEKTEVKLRLHSHHSTVAQDDVPDTVFDNRSAFVLELALKKLPSISKLKMIIDELRDNDPSITIETISQLQKMSQKYNPDPENDQEEEFYTKIKKKKEANPEIKLAKPDQWVYDFFSINHLELKLKIFSFRFRFCLDVESICASLKSLELALSDVRSCEPFIQIIKLILEIGNFLNGKEDSGFNILEFLPKLHDLKDVATNKPLLYHVIKELSKTNFKIVDDFYGEKNLKTVQNTIFFHKEDSTGKEKTLHNKIESIDEVCREFMVGLNENLSEENKRTLEPFFDDAAEKITKMKKGIDILNLEYGKFLTWLGIPPSSHKKWTAKKAAEVLLNLRSEVMTFAAEIKAEERKNARNNRRYPGMQGGGNVADITQALKQKFAGRNFCDKRVRKSVVMLFE